MNKYNAIYMTKDLGNYDSLEEAFVPIYDKLTQELKSGFVSWDVIRDYIFVNVIDEQAVISRLNFNKVKNYMIKNGYLVDGYLNKKLIFMKGT